MRRMLAMSLVGLLSLSSVRQADAGAVLFFAQRRQPTTTQLIVWIIGGILFFPILIIGDESRSHSGSSPQLIAFDDALPFLKGTVQGEMLKKMIIKNATRQKGKPISIDLAKVADILESGDFTPGECELVGHYLLGVR